MRSFSFEGHNPVLLTSYWSVLFFFNFFFNIGVQLINNVMLISGIQQSDSVIRMHVIGLPLWLSR